jgi:predicted nucleic acid-binding protein
VVRLVIDDPLSERAVAAFTAFVEASSEVVAPTLLLFEVTNVIHRYRHAQLITTATAEACLEACLRLPIRLLSGAELHLQALRLASALKLPAAYDAHYLAAAKSVEAEFWTADARLARLVGNALPWVHLVSCG